MNEAWRSRLQLVGTGHASWLVMVALAALWGCSDPQATDADGGSVELGTRELGAPWDGPAGDGLPGDDAPSADSGGSVSRLALAEHWAPVWHHDTDDSNTEGDYIVAHDFDGDHRSSNNWESLEQGGAGIDLGAVIYYSVVESETHWFILYSVFHPQDWEEHCTPIPFGPNRCHENDMEGAMVVVRKDSTPFGAFELLYTEAHNTLHIFTNLPGVLAKHTKALESTPVSFEDGSHPELYVESGGHGVCALGYSGDSHCKHPTTGDVMPGGDGVVYRYTGQAEVPASGNDRDVGYALRPLLTSLWARRDDICDGTCTFDKTMTYEGTSLSLAFDGDTEGDDKANPPWAWDDPDDGPVLRGGFFFRPAETVLTHLELPGPMSKTYLYNPYLDAL